jgi:hypothetical protein
MIWKPTAKEKDRIRDFAARSEKRAPSSLHIEIGERYNTTTGGPYKSSTNVMLVDSTPDWEESDLHDTHPWGDLKHGIELTLDGRAQVDFYVYEKLFNDHGDLLTNVQAHVAIKNGTTPVLWKVTGTGVPAQVFDRGIAAQLADEPLGADG